MGLLDSHCARNVVSGFGLGATLGVGIGVMLGTYESFSLGIPGFQKIRHIGQKTIGHGATFGLFLAAGALIQCGQLDAWAPLSTEDAFKNPCWLVNTAITATLA